MLEYLNGEAAVTSDGRPNAMARARELCWKRDVVVTREWDDVSNGGLQPFHSIAITCAVPLTSVFERVRAETGCDKVNVEGRTPVGAKMVYRLEACGAHLVCDAGATDVTCHAAVTPG